MHNLAAILAPEPPPATFEDLAVAAIPPDPFPPHSPTSSPTTAEASAPPLPDWDAWATHLPSAFREACLTYVQRRLHAWPVRRVALCAWFHPD